MAPLTELLLDVWRATGHHTEITASTPHIAHILRHHMPVQQMLVRRIDLERSCIETVGVGPDSSVPRALVDRNDCAPALLQRLVAWCHHGQVTQWQPRDRTDRALA